MGCERGPDGLDVESFELEVHAPGGRLLSVLTVGPPEGDPVFMLHGTPGVLGMYEPHVEDSARRGLRYVSYLRPGYAGSDRQPGRSVADCAADVKAIADELGIERFHAIGESGGGPHALACAALLPGRVRAVALLAGLAPLDAEGLDWEQGMGEGNLKEFEAARQGPETLREYLEAEARGLRSVESMSQLRAALDEHLCDADRAAVDGSFGEYLLAAWRSIGEDEIWGWLDDDLAHIRAWGFDLEWVAAPVTVWHGREDLVVPCAHAEWFADHLPNSELRPIDGEGHISLAAHYGAVLDALIASGP
jgi:pimeloyl-ACP methyl ester carboxylesterase